MAAGDLTTVADVKSASGIGAGTANADAVVARLITAASTFIAGYTDRSFGSAVSVSEIRNGTGGCELYLAEGPVQSITSLTVDTFAITAQVADGQPGYFLVKNEVLALYGYRFCRGKRNVRVSYTAGFTSIPFDVAQACVELVAAAYNRSKRPDVVSETVPTSGAVFSFSQADIPPNIERLLNQYKKVVPL